MNILHFTAVGRNIYSGIYVAVPQHVKAQQKKANVAVVNIYNVRLLGVENQFEYTKKFTLKQLPKPFSSPDIVIFHSVYIPQYIKIYKELVELGVPYVIVPHGSLTQMALNKRKIKKYFGNLLLFNAFVRNSSAIQYLSDREASSSNIRKEFFVSGNGIDIPNERAHNFSNCDTKFVYIGRLDTHIKGLDLLVKAVAVKKELLITNNCSFYIYGPDQEGQFLYIKNMIDKYEVCELVKLSHEVKGKEKEQILLNADVFIQTSRTEGLPMGILESLSYGVPCFVTRGTGMGEIILRYNAGWCAENSVESIAKVLERVVMEKKDLFNKSQSAERLIEENFVWNKIVENAMRQYERIVGLQEGKNVFV